MKIKSIIYLFLFFKFVEKLPPIESIDEQAKPPAMQYV